MINKQDIDHGKGFDWGKTSFYYAKYRDIYPEEFYRRIVGMGLCVRGQSVLDLGTGTGVLPRNLYRFGAKFTGADLSEEQIEQARRLSGEKGMEISYVVSPAETLLFADNSFDVVTACQCFQYFDPKTLLPNVARMLKPGGRLAILYLGWLPEESEIAKMSEALVLRYNPAWTGGGETRRPFSAPAWGDPFLTVDRTDAFDVNLTFSREGWNGRIVTCRGVGASLPECKVREFEKEHMALLSQIAPETFEIPHYATILVLKVKKQP